MFDHIIVRDMTLPAMSALQVAVLLLASAEGILNAASPAMISIGASAYTTPVVACLRKDSHSTVLLEVMLMLLISLNCCGGHPSSTSSPSWFQMGITSLNRGIYSAGLIPHLGRQKQTPPCDGVNILSSDRY